MNEERRRESGDPACWLDQVCSACGRVREDPAAEVCEHCGADVDGREPDTVRVAGAGTDRTAGAGRDRDPAGRARNARPRDGLGRPLPYGAEGVARQPEGVRRSPAETLDEAQRLLDGGMPFHAHEVFEDAWKSAPEPDRALWKGLAQLAVGLTHAWRGNTTGATALLRRGTDAIAPYRQAPPHGIDVAGLAGWARRLADGIEADPGAGPARLAAPSLRGAPPA